MEQDKLLIQFGEFISRIMGDDSEVVLHDASGKVIWIRNGHITGRKVGIQEQQTTMDLLAQHAANRSSNFISGYKSISKQGNPLKSSSFFIRDELGKIKYILCVNQNISAYIELQEQLERFIGKIPAMQAPDPSNDTLDDIVMKMILQEMEKSKPFDMESREEKIQLIARLNAKGIFAARGAVTTVCEMLHIAQPTLYKYLQELKNE